VTDVRGDLTAAYQGVDDLGAFGPAELAAYRSALLERTAVQAAFVAERLPPAARVAEVGTGNGRLLIAMAQRGVIAAACGTDLSESRIAFARDWASAAGTPGLTFEVADVLADPLPTGCDAVICITNAFAYFDAIEPGTAARAAVAMREALAPGGLLVLEVYPHAELRRLVEAQGSGTLRVWEELPADDPWRFYLSDYVLEPDTGVLHHRKVFVHRTAGTVDDSRREHLRLYEPKELRSEIAEAGFADVELFDGWSGDDDTLTVLTARRA
jgi:SAM-dependent methyltransferase